MNKAYIDATDESALNLFARNIGGEIVMLNLLRFRTVAEYAEFPDLAPERIISGREAYQRYINHTLPFLRETGGDIEFLGDGGKFFVGPQDERWDLLMLIRQDSLQSFIAFATNDAYLAGVSHRTAALEDSRLLPLERYSEHSIIG
ncbi:MAG: hypothetical protein AAF756_05690 [Pseudomonadota bacterium]